MDTDSVEQKKENRVASTPPTVLSYTNLVDDVLVHLFSFLEIQDLPALRASCKTFDRVSHAFPDAMAKIIDFKKKDIHFTNLLQFSCITAITIRPTVSADSVRKIFAVFDGSTSLKVAFLKVSQVEALESKNTWVFRPLALESLLIVGSPMVIEHTNLSSVLYLTIREMPPASVISVLKRATNAASVIICFDINRTNVIRGAVSPLHHLPTNVELLRIDQKGYWFFSEQIANEFKAEWKLPKTLRCFVVRLQESRLEFSVFLQAFFSRVRALPPVKHIVFELQSPFAMHPNLDKISDIIGSLQYPNLVERLDVVVNGVGSVVAINNDDHVMCHQYNHKPVLPAFHQSFVSGIAEMKTESLACL